MKLYSRVITITRTVRQYYQADNTRDLGFRIRDDHAEIYSTEEAPEVIKEIVSPYEVPDEMLATLEGVMGKKVGTYERKPQATLIESPKPEQS